MSARFYFIPLVLLLLGASDGLSQPTNDDCANGDTLIVEGPCVNGDNTNATTEGMPVPSCWGGNPSNYSHSIWYTFQATDDSVTVNLGGAGTLSNGLTAVYSSSNGTCSGTLTEIGCNTNSGEVELTGLTVGDTYFIMVDGGGNNVGTICISVYETPPPPPPIGTCENPRDLYPAGDCNNIGGAQYDEQNNLIFTDNSTGGDAGADAAGYGNPDGYDGGCADNDATQDAYWVRFTATSSTTTFTNEGGNALDYTVFEPPFCATTCDADCPSPCGNLTEVTCFTIASGGSNSFSTTVDSTYYVMITNSDPGTSTQRFLCITSATIYTPPNDDCANHIDVEAGVIYNGTNANATVDGSLCSGSTENNVWYEWTTPTDWTGDAFVWLFNQDCACDNGLQLSIYLSSIVCTPGGNQSGNCEIELNPNNDNDFFGQFTPTPGDTYLINIDGYAGCACEFDFTILDNNMLDIPELIADAGPDTTICIDSSVTIGGSPAATGGSGSYFYDWTQGSSLNDSTIANPTATITTTTTYVLTVTDSASGCVATDTTTVNDSICVVCSYTINLDTASTDVSCNGGSDGSATVTPSNGISPYSYQWDANTGSQTNATATGLSAGTYSVTVTDADGCTATESVTVSEPPLLTAPTLGSVAPCSCPCSGSAYVFPTGGTPNYTADWSNGYSDQFQTGLCDGTYNVTVTDANGCTATGTVTLP